MSIFTAMNIAGSGMTLHRTWLDAISDNIANVNTVRPTSESAFQARYVVAQSRPAPGGVDVGGIDISGPGRSPAGRRPGRAR